MEIFPRKREIFFQILNGICPKQKKLEESGFVHKIYNIR